MSLNKDISGLKLWFWIFWGIVLLGAGYSHMHPLVEFYKYLFSLVIIILALQYYHLETEKKRSKDTRLVFLLLGLVHHIYCTCYRRPDSSL